jgi:uncharacterized protein YndB with AHSA1/START domain
MTEMTLKPRGDREIVVMRIFNAPRDLVFDAFSKPELVKRWMLGPDGWSMAVCTIDFRVGGKGRYEWKNLDGRAMALSSEFVELVRPERIVHKEVFDGTPIPVESLVTSTFVETNGITTLTMVIRFPTPEVRDFMVNSGMEHGMARSFQRLAGIVGKDG